MSAQSLLDQLLKSGLGALGGAARPGGAGSDMGKYMTGGAVGGALGLLLGSRKGRSLGGKALKVGGVAALGALAYKAWQEYQASQAAAGTAAAPPAPAAVAPAGSGRSTLAAPASFAQLPAPAQEQQSQALLKAMIAAAKADGHMDDRERQLVEDELHRLEADPAMRRWVDAELRRPIDPADVAAAAASPEAGAEIYLASVLMVDDTTVMERAYLDELARQLQLPAALKADLEARAR